MFPSEIDQFTLSYSARSFNCYTLQVVPVYPPYDLPTWTSLATGLYPAHTGVVGDYMYNLESRQLFSGAPGELDNWWVAGEPIWSVAAKHGKKVKALK